MSAIGQFVPDPVPHIDWPSGLVRQAASRATIRTLVGKLGQMQTFFGDRAAQASMDPETVVYRVEWWEPVSQGLEGGLFWGSSRVEPGRVGDEYFMTKGHFHAIRNRGEYYTTVAGSGMLLLMDDQRRTRAEAMAPGSLHYIPGSTAHRVVNTGVSPLLFWACWPSDAGHDYATIATEGFSARVLMRDGAPALVPAADRQANAV